MLIAVKKNYNIATPNGMLFLVQDQEVHAEMVHPSVKEELIRNGVIDNFTLPENPHRVATFSEVQARGEVEAPVVEGATHE